MRQALASINGIGTPSLLARESDLAGAEYRLLADADAGRYRIRRATEAQRLAVDTPGLDFDGAAVVAQRLEHIARWVSAARLTNPATELPRDAISLEIFRERADGELELLDTASGVRYEYEQTGDGWRKPRVQIRLRNMTPDRQLFCMLLALTETYSIYPGLLHRGGVWLDPGEEAWAAEMRRGVLNKTIPVHVPDKLWQQGVTEVRDILKLIVSTDEADATLMQQDDLPVTFAPTMRNIPRNLNTLNRLMARVHTRSYGDEPGSDDVYVDWTTVEVASTIVRPAEAADAV